MNKSRIGAGLQASRVMSSFCLMICDEELGYNRRTRSMTGLILRNSTIDIMVASFTISKSHPVWRGLVNGYSPILHTLDGCRMSLLMKQLGYSGFVRPLDMV